MDNIAIERENATKLLGILIDENLSWKHHINEVSTKISKSIHILYKSREIAKQQLYYFYSLSFELYRYCLDKHL